MNIFLLIVAIIFCWLTIGFISYVAAVYMDARKESKNKKKDVPISVGDVLGGEAMMGCILGPVATIIVVGNVIVGDFTSEEDKERKRQKKKKTLFTVNYEEDRTN